MPRLLAGCLLWLGWSFLALGAILGAIYLPGHSGRINTFEGQFGLYPAGMFLFPIIVCGGFRYWTSRIENIWLKQLPYFAGVFNAYLAQMFGIYLFPEFLLLFQILCAVLYLVYLLLFVKFPRVGPPPLP